MARGLGSACIWKEKENTSPCLSNQGQEKCHNCCRDMERTGRQDSLAPPGWGILYYTWPHMSLHLRSFACRAVNTNVYKLLLILCSSDVRAKGYSPLTGPCRWVATPPGHNMQLRDNGQSLPYYWGVYFFTGINTNLLKCGDWGISSRKFLTT